MKTSEFVPLPPDRHRIHPRSTTGEQWYAMAFPNRPPARGAQGATQSFSGPSRKPEFHPPEWLIELAMAGDRDGVHWHAADQVRTAASQFTEFRKPNGMALGFKIGPEPVAVGVDGAGGRLPPVHRPAGANRAVTAVRQPRRPARVLLLALDPGHPPSLGAGGRTREGVAAAVAAYLFPGIPPQAGLPFQGRLFLSTQAMVGGGFVDVERGATASPFTDMLPWGSSHAADPYPDRVPLGQVPVGELRRYMAQAPDGLPRHEPPHPTRGWAIQLVDWRNGYFADLSSARPRRPGGRRRTTRRPGPTSRPARRWTWPGR